MFSIALGRLISATFILSVILFGSYTLTRPALPVLDDGTRLGLADKIDGEFVRLSDGLTHYKWTVKDEANSGIRSSSLGATTDTIVFIHGSSLPSFIFNANAKALADEGFRVLTYDLFGRGFSDRPIVNYDTDLFERQLNELLTQLEINQPVHLIGYSMGAVIAADFTRRHQDQIASITLIAPTGAGPALNDQAKDIFELVKDETFGPWTAKILGPITLRTLANTQFAEAQDRTELQEKFELQLQYDGYIDALISTVKNFPIVTGATDIYKKLGEIEIPVLVVWGQGDNFSPYSNLRTLRALVPKLQIRAHPTADHNIPFAHPLFVNESLKLHFQQLNWSD